MGITGSLSNIYLAEKTYHFCQPYASSIESQQDIFDHMDYQGFPFGYSLKAILFIMSGNVFIA